MDNFELFDVFKQVGEGGDWDWLVQGTYYECKEYVDEAKEENAASMLLYSVQSQQIPIVSNS
jgi:hypothetical protein